MAEKNNDWTDELRDLIEGVELTPSEGGWDRLKADLHPRRAAWWPYAVPAAACLLIGCVFLFRGQPSENVLDVVADAASPAAMVAEGARVEGMQSLQPEESRKTSASQTPPQAAPPLPMPPRSEESPSGVQGGEQVPVELARSPESLRLSETPIDPKAEAESLEEVFIGDTGPLTTLDGSDSSIIAEIAVDTAPDGSRAEAEDAPALPSISVQAPAFDFEDEPAVRLRKQRRKITVTVSAGGMFGSSGSGIYIARATQAGPVTKAEAGRVMDITEVIQHSAPVQKALGLSIPISDRLDIGTGIDHLEMNSAVGPGSQNLEWIGVPLKLGYSIASRGPSSINIGAGVKGEKCLSATLLGMNYNEPFQWAAEMGADFRIRILGPVSFCLVPEFSYYFTDTVLPTYRSGHPLTFTLHAGISFNL